MMTGPRLKYKKREYAQFDYNLPLLWDQIQCRYSFQGELVVHVAIPFRDTNEYVHILGHWLEKTSLNFYSMRFHSPIKQKWEKCLPTV